ncbi:hypothetical protein [Microcoleus sp. D3_18a_C4]|uniref:hypothetical protein n=1 Tax=unclassified Microcoleus TaxID=2642155 RepID=UPI002FD705DC
MPVPKEVIENGARCELHPKKANPLPNFLLLWAIASESEPILHNLGISTQKSLLTPLNLFTPTY